MELEDEELLLGGDVPPPDVWPEVVQPPQPAALPGALQPCEEFQRPSPWMAM
ncbi:unnamed protein product [Spirodela intermedia]|uniref:Uncharacterized protein n=1 Tax=Spirodela intermedia TaxID=51605 RepID=A0A7I8JYZ6_SPIIN|nr:unnamed protein product [Spirodela intermedia]